LKFFSFGLDCLSDEEKLAFIALSADLIGQILSEHIFETDLILDEDVNFS
jgi:hypothetical protein